MKSLKICDLDIFSNSFSIFMNCLTDLITFSEFRKAVTDNVYPTPSREQYDTIMSMARTAGNITTKQELAMFLAQVLWESAGLQVINYTFAI